ncbi:MAG: R3H domain-containing nucleic acid-binding protein [Candidatus Dormibacteria bacterium]
MGTLPPTLHDAVRALPAEYGDLLEIVLDLGRDPEARFEGQEVVLSPEPVSPADIEYVTSRIGAFGGDNRAGIARTLHRISAIRNRSGEIIGLTCRVGRAVTGRVEIIRDIVVSGQSLLLLGKPGVGKTTMLREVARILADESRKRVVVVDTSNEIAGDGDIPHRGIGRARRMQVARPELQHAVMIEAVENHMPEVIVIDEIGTELEATAARTIAERGVQLVATAHGNTLDNLLVNPTLNDLLGGIQTVTLSDEEARRRGTQKSVLERKAPPTFDALIEIVDRHRVTIHMPLSDVVDDALRGRPHPAQLREMREGRGFATRLVEPAPFDDRGSRELFAQEAPGRARRPTTLAELAEGRADGQGGGADTAVFPYGVSRVYLEQAVRELRVPVRIQHHVDDADMVLTLKNYYRRRDSPLRTAEADGIPISILRSNTVAQIRTFLSQLYNLEPGDPTDAALQEARDGIERARQGTAVELAPQNAYIRRLQHQLVEECELVARSTGREPRRRLRIYPAAQAS